MKAFGTIFSKLILILLSAFCAGLIVGFFLNPWYFLGPSCEGDVPECGVSPLGYSLMGLVLSFPALLIYFLLTLHPYFSRSSKRRHLFISAMALYTVNKAFVFLYIVDADKDWLFLIPCFSVLGLLTGGIYLKAIKGYEEG